PHRAWVGFQREQKRARLGPAPGAVHPGVESAGFVHAPELALDPAPALLHRCGDRSRAVDQLHLVVAALVSLADAGQGEVERGPDVVAVEVDTERAAGHGHNHRMPTTLNHVSISAPDIEAS